VWGQARCTRVLRVGLVEVTLEEKFFLEEKFEGHKGNCWKNVWRKFF
jgi:hypothetical protein